MKNKENCQYSKILILGSGPAGYTASIYSARANLKPTLITGVNVGGQLINTNSIENWPGDYHCIRGFQLMERFLKQTIQFGTNVIYDDIKTVNLQKKPFILESENNKYLAETLIIATGALPRYLGLKSENVFKGKGVSTCAICDGFFYKDKPVAIVGGGNTAVEESLYLSKIASVVYLIHRKDHFTAEKILLSQLLKKIEQKKIILFKNFNIIEIMGDAKGVHSIKIESTINKTHKKIINVFGLFIAIGHYPNTAIFSKQLEMYNGYIKIHSGIHGNVTSTNIPGVFAAGDAVDHVYKQAITASASGCMAALDAEKYLETINKINNP